MHARDGHGFRPVDRADARVRMRRAQQLHMQQTIERDVGGIARRAGDHGGPGGRRQVSTARLAG